MEVHLMTVSLPRTRPSNHILLVVALLLVAARPARAGMIFNGDFEKGNVGFTSDYSTPGLLDQGWYQVLTDPHLANPYAVSYHDHTTGSGLMMAVNGPLDPNAVVWSQ